MNVTIPIPVVSESLFPYLWLAFFAISTFFWWRIFLRGVKRVGEGKEGVDWICKGEAYFFHLLASGIMMIANAITFLVFTIILASKAMK